MGDSRNEPEAHAGADPLPAGALENRSVMPADVIEPGAEFALPHDREGQEPFQRPLTLKGLMRFKGTIAAVSVLAATAFLTGIWTLVVPKFGATAIIEVAPVIPRLLDKTEDTGMIPLYQQHLASQEKILASSEVLNRVLDRPEVQRTEWYRRGSSSLPDRWQNPLPPRDRLAQELRVSAPKHTQLLFVSMETSKPGEAKLIVDCAVEEYLRYVKNARFEEDDQLLTTLDAMQKDLSYQIKLLEDEIAKLQKALQTNSPDELVLQRRLGVEQLESQLRALELDLRIARQALNDSESDGPASSQPAARQYLLDDEWRRLAQAVEDAQHRLAVESERFGDANPTLVRYRKEAEHARHMLARREKQLDEQRALGLAGAHAAGSSAAPGALPPQTLPGRISQLENRRVILSEEIAVERSDFEAMFDTAQALARKTEQLRVVRAELTDVVGRISELEQKRKTPASIRRIGKATEPSRATADKRPKLSAVALLAALGAGMTAAFLRLKYSPTIHESGEVSSTSAEAFLGCVPLRPQGWGSIEECPVRAECVRSIRTSLLQRLGDCGGQVIQTTSAASGAGKTTFAILLARSLAQCGKRVLLVDGDLRKPSVAQRLAIEPGPGLVNLLADPTKRAACIRETVTPRLDVLPAGGPVRGQDVESLADGVFSGLLEEWRGRYDVIMFDSGPLLPVADAAILAQRADGTILLVRERHCRRSEVRESLALLNASGGKLLGTVFVGSDLISRYESAYYGLSYPA